MNLIKVKAIVSMGMIILFVIVGITGLGLYLAPTGKIAKLSEWTFLGMNRFELKNLHTNLGFIFVGLAILHIILNYKLLINELKFIVKWKD